MTYHLTSPVRLIRGLIILALATAFALSGFNGSVATDSPATGQGAVSFEYVTVFSGDTLWGLAQRHGSGDPRDFIYEIMRLNGLQTADLVPGTQLALPKR
jgi:LysM repeat protein